MDTTKIVDSQVTSANSTLVAKDQSDSLSTVTDTSFSAKTHAEKASILEQLYEGNTQNTQINTDSIVRSTVEGSNGQNGSFINYTPAFSPVPRKETRNEAYVEIIRAHYIRKIVRALQRVQAHASMASASVYINIILQAIQELEKKSPEDPVLEILLALYDALAFDGLWTTYTAEQFAVAERVLGRVVNEPINTKKIENAIFDLNEAGLDTLPYSFSSDDEDEF